MSEETIVDNKRIARNSLYLYLRMFITMWLTLYTSRFLLQVLGVDDYGIYSVVGGIAVLFSFISSSLLVTTERFIATTIAKKDSSQIRLVFSSCVNIHLLICLIIFIISETIGLWVLNNYIVIPDDKIYSANVVFQFSLLFCLYGVVSSPFHACVVAYERFSFYSIEGIVITILKLLILVIVWFVGGNSLIVYSALYSCIGLLGLLLNFFYCKYKLPDLKYEKVWDKKLLKDIFSFTGLSFMRNGAFACFTQGSNILLNTFGGIVLSAAYGISVQVYGSCMTFMHNVQTAFYPQIMKSCSAQEYDSLFLLIRRAAKFSNYMIMFIGIPIILNIDYVLKIWLGNVPLHANELSIIMIISCFVESFTEPLNTAIYAHGRVKYYQICISVLWVITTLLLGFALWAGFECFYAYCIRLVAQIGIVFFSCYILSTYIKFPYELFFRKECLQSICIILISIGIPTLMIHLTPFFGIVRLVITSLISWACLVISIYKIGISSQERQYILTIITKNKK